MAEDSMLTWGLFSMYFAAGSVVALLVLVSIATVLDAAWRWRRARRGEGRSRSGIYAGRVWHIRFKPTVHRFSYPIFYCLLDLDELEVAFPWFMWPVGSAKWPALARFQTSDHLKGAANRTDRTAKGPPPPPPLPPSSSSPVTPTPTPTQPTLSPPSSSSSPPPPPGAGGKERVAGGGGGGVAGLRRSAGSSAHADRVRDIVEAAVGARPKGRVQLLTHLAYWGYCFNPVSFYYCLDESEKNIETVVAEVSNTPWGEMHCYVLNPKTQGVEVVSTDKQGLVRYKFDKEFHVSPFMSMNHTYDWKLTPPQASEGSELIAQTTLLEPESGKIFFDAKATLKRQPFSAAGLCWYMAAYPLYTRWVQFLIHYQAFLLWSKQVPFFPHPEGAETMASRLVGVVMKPLFDAQEAWETRRQRRQADGPSNSDSHRKTD